MAEFENVTPQEKTEKKKRKVYSVLSKNLTGGPHGVGDPDDKTLRKVEKDVLIAERIRYKSRTEKCVDVWKAFGECAKEAGLLVTFKCRAENKELQECLKYWFENEEFVAECQQEYLDDRSQYRRTGIPVKKYIRKRHSAPQTET